MNVNEVLRDVEFVPKPNEVRSVLCDFIPPTELTTSVAVFAFQGDRLLLANLSARGWDLPAGHIEAGESMVQALHREVWEETACTIVDIEVLGHTHIRLLGPKPDGYQYPYPDSYMVVYTAVIDRMEPFEPTDESADRRLFSPAETEGIPAIETIRVGYKAAYERLVP